MSILDKIGRANNNNFISAVIDWSLKYTLDKIIAYFQDPTQEKLENNPIYDLPIDLVSHYNLKSY